MCFQGFCTREICREECLATNFGPFRATFPEEEDKQHFTKHFSLQIPHVAAQRKFRRSSANPVLTTKPLQNTLESFNLDLENVNPDLDNSPQQEPYFQSRLKISISIENFNLRLVA